MNKTNYMESYKNGTLHKNLIKLKKHIYNCHLCPHKCGVDRRSATGFCKSLDKAVVSSYGPHFGEEKILTGRKGSGTIFFAYCNMRCVFCQNYELSHYGRGNTVTAEKLSKIMLLLQNHYRCSNINLVTPTHFTTNIVEALSLAMGKGLNLPIIYNCGGYESLETLQLLDGVIDIYMPDFKYFDNTVSEKYSKITDYPNKVKRAIKEMDRQVGGLKIAGNGLTYKGLLIRHLILPGGLKDTKKILNFIKAELSADVGVNLMEQYYPAHKASQYPEIGKRLEKLEYVEAIKYAEEIGINLI